MLDFHKEREAFELWAIKASGGWASFSKSHGDVYANNKLQFAWETWQAAKAQVLEGFALVPKTITDEWMGPFVVRLVCDYVEEYKGLPFEVKDSEIPGIEENYRWPIRQAHEKLMKVIEAQEQGQ